MSSRGKTKVVLKLEAENAALREVAVKAAAYIEKSPCDHDIYKDQLAAWYEYQEAMKKAESICSPTN